MNRNEKEKNGKEFSTSRVVPSSCKWVMIDVGLEKPVANWAKNGEADAEEYPVLRRWRKKVSPVSGALRGHSS